MSKAANAVTNLCLRSWIDSMSTNRTNLVAEFYAMSRLFLEGYEATLTLGNTKGIDILLYNPKNGKQFRVEVKGSTTIVKSARVLPASQAGELPTADFTRIFRMSLYCLPCRQLALRKI